MRTPFIKPLLQVFIIPALGAGLPQSLLASTEALDATPSTRATQLPLTANLQAQLIELKNAVLASPDDSELRYRLGITYLRVGNGAAAEKELNRAIALGRDDFEVRAKLAEAWLAQGKYQDVILDADLKAEIGTENEALVQTLYGQAQLGRERVTDAREAFDRALQLRPDYGPGLSGLAQIELAAGEYGAVELLLARMETGADPDPVVIAELRGDLRMALGDFEGAEAAYRAGAAAEPARTDLLRDAAFAMMSRGNFEAAEAELRKVLKIAPSDANAKLMLAMAAFEQQRFERAVELAAKLTDSDAPIALYIAGASAQFLGQHEIAAEYLSRYVAQQPGDASGRRVYAAALIALGNGAEAYRQLEGLAESADDVGLLVLLGQAAVLSDKPQQGVEYLQRAADLAPDNSALAAQLTAARLAAGDRERGMAELKRLAAEPDAVGARDRLLIEQVRFGEFDAALEQLDRTGANAPDSTPRSQLLHARALLGKGETAQAETLLRELLKADPADFRATTVLADLLLRRGDTASAIALAQDVAQRNPDEPFAQLVVAEIELRTNRQAAAEQRIQQLLRQDPAFIDARAALVGAYLSDQRWEDAKLLIDDAPDQETPVLSKLRGLYELGIGRPAAAATTLGRALEMDPAAIDTRLALARASRDLGDNDAAFAALEAAAAIAPEDLRVRFERARLIFTDFGANAEQLRIAVADTRAIRDALGKSSADVSALMAQLALRDGQNETGLALLRKVQETLRSSDALVAYTDALWSLGQRREAVQTSGRWLEIHPQDVKALLTRGNYWFQAAEYGEAAADLTQARDLGAELPWLNPLLAYSLAKSGDVSAAAPLARAAVDADSEDPLALNALAVVSLARGEPRVAKDLLEQAMEQVDGTPPASLRLDYAEALNATGAVAESKQLAQQVLDGLTEQSPLHARAQSLATR